MNEVIISSIIMFVLFVCISYVVILADEAERKRLEVLDEVFD